jgi:hypothetical protein
VHGLRGHPQTTWEESEKPEIKVESSAIRNRANRFKSVRTLLQSRQSSSSAADNNGNNGESSSKSTVFWPQDYLTQDIPEARVWTYGYNADVIGIFEAKNHNSVSQHGQDLAVKLERDIENQVCPHDHLSRTIQD